MPARHAGVPACKAPVAAGKVGKSHRAGSGGGAVCGIQRRICQRPAKNARDGEIHAIANVQTELNFEVKDGDTPLEVNELVVDEDWGSTRVYDSAHLNRLIDVSGTSAEECRRRIEQNRDIPEKFKDYFTDFVNRIETKYPDADLSVLCHNLESLRVEELNDQAYLMKTASVDHWASTSIMRTPSTSRRAPCMSRGSSAFRC